MQQEREREGELLKLAEEDKRQSRMEETEQERSSWRRGTVRLHWDSEASKRRSRQRLTTDAE